MLEDSGEYQKINQWIAGLMKIAFGKYSSLPVSINDSNEKAILLWKTL